MQLNIKNWNEENYNLFIDYLKTMADEKYREFHKGLVPGLESFLGIQMPKLRNIAKDILKGNYMEFLKIAKNDLYEETMIKGLVISNANLDYTQTIILINKQLPYINNWALCDSFCSKFKGALKNKREFLIFLKDCIKTDKEYYIRFAIIMLKVMYIEEEYIPHVIEILDEINSDKYYVKMAIAWTLCDLYIKDRTETTSYLTSENNLDDFTFNKTIQKITESIRVTEDNKNIARSLKRK